MRKSPSSLFRQPGKKAEPQRTRQLTEEAGASIDWTSHFDRKSVAVLSLSHACNDLAQGAVPAMLPYLISLHSLNYEGAAGLVLSSTLLSSLLQPLFGALSDSRILRFSIAPIGLAICGVSTGLIGIMPDYQMLVLCTAVGGIGNAAFHPDSGRLTNFAAGDKKPTGMGFFSVGGSLGFSVAPLLTSVLIHYLGMASSLFLMVPALTMAFALQKQAGAIETRATIGRLERSAIAAFTEPADSEQWLPFSLLTLSLISRSVVFFTLLTFLPLYFMQRFHESQAGGESALTVFLLASAIATVAGGRLADRTGDKKLLLLLMGCLPLAIALFLCAPVQSLALLALLAVGSCVSGTVSTTIVLGQNQLGHRIGLAAGITMGLAGSIGGLAAPYFGKLADASGIEAALEQLVAVAFLSLVLIVAMLITQREISSSKES